MLFYDNLKAACEEKGLKISPTVVECGGALGSISKWKNGAYPNSDIVIKLAMRLGVTSDYLLGLDKSIRKEGISYAEYLTDNTPKKEYTECYVAYFDVLGFKDYINKGNFEMAYNFFDIIDTVKRMAYKDFKSTFLTAEMLSKVKFTIVSDSVIASIPKDEPYSLTTLVFMVNTMVSNLLICFQLLVRGAIAEGNFYDSNNTIFGPALNKAVDFENKFAKFPRIIIQTETVESYKRKYLDCDEVLDRANKYIISDPIINDSNISIIDYIKYTLYSLPRRTTKETTDITIKKIISKIEEDMDNPDKSVSDKNLYFARLYNYELAHTEDNLVLKNKRVNIPPKFNDYTFDFEAELNPILPIDLTVNEQECIKKFSSLTDIDKGRILDRMETMYNAYSAGKPKAIFIAARNENDEKTISERREKGIVNPEILDHIPTMSEE